MSIKRVNAHFYTTVRINEGYKAPLFKDPETPLFSCGRYRTKISAADLPEWYAEGRFCSQWGYVSAKGVKHLIYKPSYRDYSYKDDCLLISYDKPIVSEADGFTGHDIVIYGIFIVSFIEAVAKFSDIDIGDIQAHLAEKSKWNKQQNATKGV